MLRFYWEKKIVLSQIKDSGVVWKRFTIFIVSLCVRPLVWTRSEETVAKKRNKGKTINSRGRTMEFQRKDQSVFEVRIAFLLTILMWISFKLWVCVLVWKDFVTRGFRWIWVKPETKPLHLCQTTIWCVFWWKSTGSGCNLFSWKTVMELIHGGQKHLKMEWASQSFLNNINQCSTTHTNTLIQHCPHGKTLYTPQSWENLEH